jgi:hypothetical protein
MKSLFPLLLAGALALGSLACRSQSPSTAEGVECVCGQPLAEMQGCPHPTCASGHTNPDNPDCVCGTLSIPR